MRKFLCGTPSDSCNGKIAIVSSGLKSTTVKVHSSTEEAFACHAKHLTKQGYTRVGSREFAAPNNGPIRVLTRRSKFGGELRLGKEGRFMPSPRTGGLIIVS